MRAQERLWKQSAALRLAYDAAKFDRKRLKVMTPACMCRLVNKAGSSEYDRLQRPRIF